MELVLYIHKESGENGKRFKTQMENVKPFVSMVLIQDFKTLESRLSKPAGAGSLELFVLFADTVQRLDRFTEFIHEFEDRRLLLVLPDKDPKTLSKTHKLRPRFFTYLNESYEDLCAVIGRINEQGGKNDTGLCSR